jgi:hypothetical protein
VPEFVFAMHDLRKAVGPDRVPLDGITLALVPGAKIGVGDHRADHLRRLGADADQPHRMRFEALRR